MIERKFISENIKEFKIKEYVAQSLNKVGLSDVKLQRTPLGEKIVVGASRPGLVVGRAGSNIQKLTKDLKAKFNLENPQIEIEEIKDIWLDPRIVAEYIAGSLERFGTKQFKGTGHRSLSNVMDAGAMGVEILISGKIPSQRAKVWRFYLGYLKKCGDVAVSQVKVAYTTAFLKTGAIGVKVSIMPAETILPDHIEVLPVEEPVIVEEEVTGEEAEKIKEDIEEKTEEEVVDDKAKEAAKELLKEAEKKPKAKAKDKAKTKTKKATETSTENAEPQAENTKDEGAQTTEDEVEKK